MDNNKQAPASDPHDAATCPYCSEIGMTDPDQDASAGHDDCPYCAEIAAPDAHADCPYCQEMEETHDCPYCQEMDAEKQIGDPGAAISQDYAGQDLDEPAMPKPMPGEEAPLGLGVTEDEQTVNNEILAEDQADPSPADAGPAESVQLDHSKEAMQSIAQQIESDGTPGQISQQESPVNTASPAAAGDAHMEENVSRPEDFDQNAPSDMGISDEVSDPEPDITEVLTEGLDSQSDGIQRERVVQMVSQALEGFKASKHIIEQSQQQSPQLYQSSISMLRAMIEMCKMLGLGAEGAPVNEDPADEWSDPFPTHPDHGGQPKAGQAPSASSPASAPAAAPSNEGAVGQSIGKLPTSATTPHVARTPQLPGAVNTKGQKKVIDPETGETRWIDMKEGRVQSPEGIPVKPPKQGEPNGAKA